jgi:hypothetical protein
MFVKKQYIKSKHFFCTILEVGSVGEKKCKVLRILKCHTICFNIKASLLEKQKESSKNPSPDTLKLEILFQLVRVAHSDKLSSFRLHLFYGEHNNLFSKIPFFEKNLDKKAHNLRSYRCTVCQSLLFYSCLKGKGWRLNVLLKCSHQQFSIFIY